jgi:site-specific recombinase XerD
MLEASSEPRVQPRARGRARAARTALGGLRDQALLATAYATLARRGELVALFAEDLHTDADGWGMIAIRRSKTDQEAEGAVAGIAPDAMAQLAAARITRGPVFRNVDRHGRVGAALEPGSVSRIFKAMARAAGLTARGATNFSGHSTRVGGAQDLIRFNRMRKFGFPSRSWDGSIADLS